jgi:histone-lysine N-methyltransferase SETMAR
MLTLCWDERGVILEHYMPRGNTVNTATYAHLKNHLRPAIKSKRRGLLSTGVLLQHENARPHTARSSVATVLDLSFQCLPYPPYSPDLSSGDFHVFGPLKKAMECKSFRSDVEVQQAASGRPLSQNTFFLEVFMHF